MSASPKHYEIFPDILKKFTPTINLIAEFNHPIAQDILVYYGNVINAEFVSFSLFFPPFVHGNESNDCGMILSSYTCTDRKKTKNSIYWKH